MQTRGRCWKFGDNVPTDAIVKSHLVFRPMEELVQHVLEDLNPDFPRRVQKGDVLVAGHHFGQSSGRAIAPKVLQATGLGAIVAESFARTFYRNCFEIGLPILECPGITEQVDDGDILHVDVASGLIVNETKGERIQALPTPPFLMEMLKAGGLLPLAPRLAEEG